MPVPVTTIYGHTDFRLIAGETLYLHAGGALGPNGQVAGIQCEPGFGEKERLTAFAMRGPVSGERLRAGCEALARLVEVFTDRKDIGTALLAAGLRAPFGHMTSMLALVGSTGGGKSEGAALVQTMYAPGLDSQSFAACWYDTPTTLEGSMFWIRDGVLVIDDYAPEGTKRDQYRLEQTLARVIRSIGNHSSRGRSNADLSARPDRPPMCLPIATLETAPKIASQIARCIIVIVPLHHCDSAVLTKAQGEANLRAEATATMICRMASDRRKWLDEFKARKEALQAEARLKLVGIHPRVPDSIADLAAGLLTAAEILPELGEILDLEEAWATLLDLGEAQGEHIAEGDQGRLFLRMVRAAVASKKAHLSPANLPERDPPEDCADSWGWTKVDDGFQGNDPDKYRPPKFRGGGDRIGYVADGGLVHLIPEAAYAVAEMMAEKKRHRSRAWLSGPLAGARRQEAARAP